MKKIIFLLFIIILSPIILFSEELDVIDLTKHKWEYKWGDSTFKEGVPLWTKDETLNWQTIQYPSNPPNRNANTNIWYRVKLPNKLTADPHVYIFSIDLLPEVYYKGEKIYSFGKLDIEGKGEYSGWPWHMFSLPEDSAGEYLYFRIYSHYLDIGMFGEILISSKGEIFKRFLDYDIPKLLVGSVAIFVSFLFLLSFLLKPKRVELAIVGMLFLTQGLNVLFLVKITQVYLFYPLFKQYILAFCFFFFPVGMAMYLDRVIPFKVPFNIIRRVWQVHLAYIVYAIFGALFGFFDVSSTYEYFDKLYYFITLPILTLFMIYFFIKGNNEIKLITTSFLIVSAYWIYSFLVAYHILPWTEYPSDLAIFLSLLLLSYSIVKNINYTSELEDEKKELTVLSSTDYLTKLYNRKEIDVLLKNNENIFKRYKDSFSIVLLDIDDFKYVNDTHGHLVGDKFLIEFGNILSRFTRETDFVGRWGGEEFIIICPKSSKDDALTLAENIRSIIAKNQFDLVGHKTASIGVATYQENDSITELLSRADDAMYLSKNDGKNRVSFK